ncbi:polysaccharide pyruvyl transferase family protein [bacterium]|nr:polysaccharide pyruvyl transferase family protein [bacterium]
MRFLILAGDIRRNFGDTAIALGVLKLLREVDPEARIRIAGPPPLLAGGFEGVSFVPGQLDILREARDADLVAWGGGQLMAGNRSRAKVPLWAARIELMQRLGARIVGVGQGVGPLPSPSDLRWTAHAVSRTVAFTVRDDESARNLRAGGVPDDRFSVAADPAVLLAPEGGPVPAPGSGRAVLGISPRWTAHHHAGRWIPFRFQPASVKRKIFRSAEFLGFERALVALADRLIAELDVDVAMFPTYRAPWESDEPLSDAVARDAACPERVSVVRPQASVDELLDAMRPMSFFLGMPMHATILATTQGVPTMALPYEPKGTEYFRALGMPELLGPKLATVEDVDDVVRSVTSTWERRAEIRVRLAERVAALRVKARGTADTLRSALPAERTTVA